MSLLGGVAVEALLGWACKGAAASTAAAAAIIAFGTGPK
jgi:hypothetical protein